MNSPRQNKPGRVDFAPCEETSAQNLASGTTFAEAIAMAPVAVFIGSSKGHFRYVNRRAVGLTGFDRDELLTMAIGDLFPPDVLAENPLRIDKLEDGHTVRNERQLQRKDGRRFWVDMHSVMLPDGHGVCFMHDISRRKEAETGLFNSMRKYRELFEKTDDAILIIENGQFVDCNQATVRMLRYASKEELLNTHPSELSPPTQPDGKPSFSKAEEMMRIAMERGSHRFEWNHKRADGEVFPVEVLLTSVAVENDRHILHTVWRDITNRKLAEEKLLQAQKMDSVGLLAGGVAHDFNNMLGGIMGYTSLLLETEQDPERRNSLAEIQRAAERSADLTRKLLAFAREGKHLVSAVDLNVMVSEVIALLRHSFDKKIEMAFRPGSDLHTVDADPGQMHQVVMNLCVNACQAMPDGGAMTVTTGNIRIPAAGDPHWPHLSPGEHVALTVTDTGVGMTENVRRRAFEPFFTTREDGNVKGTGLGLSTVYGIVRNHGGDVHVQSAPGTGTTMTVCLPRGVRRTATAPAGEAPRRTGSGCILVVEDEEIVRGMAARMLEALGHEVLLARDGLEGLEVFRDNRDRIDGVLLDLKMPRMDGMEAFRRMREIDPQVRVLLSTGYGLNEESQQVLDAGALGLVAKPYRLKELSAAVQCLLR